MKFRFFLFLTIALFSSCATMTTRKYYKLNICSNQENSSLKIYDTVYQLPAKVKVKRSIEDLPIVLKTDTIEKEFILKASPSRTSVFGNLPYMYLMPIAYYVDHRTQKRYYYGQNITLDLSDEKIINKGYFPMFAHRIHDYFQKEYPGKKGQINVIMGNPLLNNLYLDNNAGKRDYNFFGGVKAGLEYFYRNNKYLSLTVSHVHEVVFKGINDEYLEPFSTSIELKDNYGYKRFAFGYGLSYSVNQLTEKQKIDGRRTQGSDEEAVKTNYRNYCAGLAFNTHYRFHNNVFFGISYRPNVLLLENKNAELRYEHLISAELLFKLRLKK